MARARAASTRLRRRLMAATSIVRLRSSGDLDEAPGATRDGLRPVPGHHSLNSVEGSMSTGSGTTLGAVVEEAQKLLADGSTRSRSLVAAAIARLGDLPRMTPTQREEWRRLVEIFARDRDTVVRAVLAETVKRNPNIPAGAAEQMARDVIDVARPILAHCEALSDEVLIELVEEGDHDKQDAIVARQHISEGLARVIIDECEQSQVARLAANNGAELSEDDLERILERFDNAWPVVTGLAKRDSLPPAVAAKVVARVTSRLKAGIRVPEAAPRAVDAGPPPDAAGPMAAVAADAAPVAAPAAPAAMRASPGRAEAVRRPKPVRVGMAAESYCMVEEARTLARQMHQQGKLKPIDALKAVCTGDLAFFEAAIAARADMPLGTVQSMLHDPRVGGFTSVTEKARIPGTFLPLVRAALAAIAETPFDGMPGDRQRFVDTVIARVLTQVDEVGGEMLEFLVDQFAPASPAAGV
jgi:uncharacterized protein (DUF2336 family)